MATAHLERVATEGQRGRFLVRRAAREREGVPELFARAHDGDAAAREALVERFLPLARQLARRYARTSESFDDLLQVASLGLVKAVDRFDHDRGVAFSTFAVPTILGELKRHFRDTGWAVHVPRSLYERAMKVEQAERTLANRTGRKPSVTAVATELDMGLEEVLAALEASQAYDALSLDAPTDSADGERESLGAGLGCVDARLELVEDVSTVAATLPELSERERRVLELRFGREMTQSQIAGEIGGSQMQVSRIIRRALERLRELAEAA